MSLLDKTCKYMCNKMQMSIFVEKKPLNTKDKINLYEFIQTFVKTKEKVFDLKACHSSSFQTISRRSVYIKIINYSGSILVNVNSTMKTKQHAMKKPHSYSNRKKDLQRAIFGGGRVLST